MYSDNFAAKKSVYSAPTNWYIFYTIKEEIKMKIFFFLKSFAVLVKRIFPELGILMVFKVLWYSWC